MVGLVVVESVCDVTIGEIVAESYNYYFSNRLIKAKETDLE